MFIIAILVVLVFVIGTFAFFINDELVAMERTLKYRTQQLQDCINEKYKLALRNCELESKIEALIHENESHLKTPDREFD